MVGHQVYFKFKTSGNFSAVKGTMRGGKELLKKYNFFILDDIYDNVDLYSGGFGLMKNIILEEYKPDVVVNCIGIKLNNKVEERFILINSYLPYYVAKLLDLYKGKLIQISTDGVFSGNRGNYSENDIADAGDIYGQSKFFGEIERCNHITIRTSIFGHELFNKKTDLLEWFISSNEPTYGYENVFFSGISTNLLSDIIIRIINFKKIEGILNIGSKEKISKYDLLSMINEMYELKKKIVPIKVDRRADRSLDVTKMNNLGILSLNYEEIIRDMKEIGLKMGVYHARV